MTFLSHASLKTRAVVMMAGVILLALSFNTLVSAYSASSRYKEALLAKATAQAEGVIKDINKALGFGIPLNALDGTNEKLRMLMDEDKDLSRSMIMDLEGRVLYSGDSSEQNAVLSDEASRRAAAASDILVHSYSDAAGGHLEKVIPLTGPDGRKVGVFRVGLRSEAVNRQVWSLLFWSLTVALVSAAAAVLLVSFFVTRMITSPIQSMAENASRMAAGNLASTLTVSGKAEIAVLGGAINTMSEKLREILGRIRQTGAGLSEALQLMSSAAGKMSQGARVQQEATEQTAMTVAEMTASIQSVSENAGEMSRAAGEASSSTLEMASSVEEVAQNTENLSRSVEETASSVEEMLASIRQVTDNTEMLAVSAEETTASISELSASVKEVEQRAVESARLAEKVSEEASVRGMGAAAEAGKGMENIRKTVEATADVVNRLGKRSQEIGQILKVIDEVTDQTGLLALNAAILAAQAGEHGKGFAVVAEEIKELAERTAASTQEISNLIASVQEETAQSVQAMSKGIKAVEAGSALVTVTSGVLQQVADTAKQAAGMARAIEKTTGEQARGVSQISEAAVSIAHQIEQIASAMQEQRRGSERIVQAAEKMRDITRHVSAATREQARGGKQIAEAVESVTAQAGQVARSTSEQNQGAKQINEAVARIQKITQENVDVSIEMDIAVQMLKEKLADLQAELNKFKF